MFTNWLTSPPISSASSSMGVLPPTVIATPPDIILEVGPTPSARFVAHSLVLAMHSGYLRSAIRLDENGVPNSDLPIFLTNVTPEQFSPLLTYMYTGYLDLNIENIFGVLLATHVLHMPRALEICRSFLSRMQSEGYLSGAFLSHLNETNNNSTPSNSSKFSNSTSSISNSVKVIRPIASKPTIPNLGFIVPPMPHISLPSTGTPFRSLNNNNTITTTTTTINQNKSSINMKLNSESRESDNIPSSPLPNHSSSKSIIRDLSTSTTSTKRSPKLKRPSTSSLSSSMDKSKRTTEIQHHQQPTISSSSTTSRKEFSSTSSTADNENKIIIDVASCDGPVRFRRVLNDAYGKQPQTIDILNAHSQERSHQSVSHSFHQQMAKNISNQQQDRQHQHHHHQQQQQQQQQHHSEESENSEDSSTKHHQHQSNARGNSNSGTGAHHAQSNNNGEVYNCIYCKHTFKSQYCYQKHAKRHLNPLSLDANDGGNNGSTSNNNAGGAVNHSSSASSSSSSVAVDIANDKNDKTITISNHHRSTMDSKREVRPLDMNVQYYPCKTCGSKFPSYYFVHKHRKMCHANEENQQ